MWPIASLRHVADIRLGVLTIQEKWELLTGMVISTDEAQIASGNLIYIRANMLPSADNYLAILDSKEDMLTDVASFQYPWQLLSVLSQSIEEDCRLLSKVRRFQQVPDHVTTINPSAIFIEEGAEIAPCIINASTGSVFISKNALIMEGATIRGPFVMGEGAVLKMGARIYGPVVMGPYCVVGGEVKNSLLLEYSKKAHEGYLGDSVIGSWCNLGAGTTSSNVKNTAGEVFYHTPAASQPIAAGKKAGLIMGDYSRTAINSSFNTGSMVGICCHIARPSFSPVIQHDFMWNDEDYECEKLLQHIGNWKKFAHQSLEKKEEEKIINIYKKIKQK